MNTTASNLLNIRREALEAKEDVEFLRDTGADDLESESAISKIDSIIEKLDFMIKLEEER